jgi:hypothetical protein
MRLLPRSKPVARQVLAIACAAVLASCGGGDPADFDPVLDTAEGIWVGTSSTGFSVSMAILEDGSTWGVYMTGASGPIVGAIHAETRSSDGRLGGLGQEFNIPTRSVTGFSYLGTYVPRGSIKAETSTFVQLTGTYKASYLDRASLDEIAGTYTGSAVTGTSPVQSISATISPNGAVTVAPSLGCSASGSVLPRPSRRNVFDIAITFVGASCALGNGATATGIALYDRDTRRAIVMGLNTAKSDGFIAVAVKQ